MGVSFKVDERSEFTTVSFTLDQSIEPTDLALCNPPEVKPTKGVVEGLSGCFAS